jgi:hypothetical protein
MRAMCARARSCNELCAYGCTGTHNTCTSHTSSHHTPSHTTHTHSHTSSLACPLDHILTHPLTRNPSHISTHSHQPAPPTADPKLRLRFSRGGTSSGEHGTFAVTNPATGAHLAECPDMSAAETAAAISTASAAFPAWSATPAKTRSALLRAWHDKVVANADYLAALMTAEQGKPLAEAHGEVMYGAS